MCGLTVRKPFSRSLGDGDRRGDRDLERDSARGVMERRGSDGGVRVRERPLESLREGERDGMLFVDRHRTGRRIDC